MIVVAAASLASCAPEARLECVRPHLCLALPPGSSVGLQELTLAGRIEGEQISLEPGAQTYVLRPRDELTLEVHQLWLDGARVFDVGDAARGVTPIVSVRPTGAPPVLLLPSGWARAEVLVRASGPGGLDVVRIGPGEGSVLRVDVHRLDASMDEADARESLQRAAALLGIALDARFPPHDPALRALGEASAYDASSLGRAAHSAPGRVSLFLVPSDGLPSLGSTPSVPLSPLDGDRALVVEARSDLEAVSRAIAHELGHALGLLHVSEADGWLLEALEDTPTCLVDLDGDGAVRASDCPEAAANLMFWQDVGGTALSAEQRRVMLRSALLF